MEDIVIPYRPKDKRGTELIFALGRRLAGGSVQGVEMKSFQWPLDDGSARYHLFGESVGADCLGGDCLEPELTELDHTWRDHLEGP